MRCPCAVARRRSPNELTPRLGTSSTKSSQMASRLSMITVRRPPAERGPEGASELPGGVAVPPRLNWRLPMPCRCRRGHEWPRLRGFLAQTERHFWKMVARQPAAGRRSEPSFLQDRGPKAGPPNDAAVHLDRQEPTLRRRRRQAPRTSSRANDRRPECP